VTKFVTKCKTKDIHAYFDGSSEEDTAAAKLLQKDLKKEFPDIPVFPLVPQ
jgi:hypothetical protein